MRRESKMAYDLFILITDLKEKCLILTHNTQTHDGKSKQPSPMAPRKWPEKLISISKNSELAVVCLSFTLELLLPSLVIVSVCA